MTITGRCLCGAVTYTANAEPLITRFCWCRVCQYLAAGNATVNVCFPTEALTITGELRDFRSIAASGNVMHRRFCPTCGTPMVSMTEARPHLIFVRAGTLDDSTVAKPATTIWTGSAPAWACINEALPQFVGQPPPPSSPPASPARESGPPRAGD